MQRKYIALFIALLVFSVLFIGGTATSDIGNTSDEEGKLNVTVSTKVDLVDPNGNTLMMLPFVPQAVLYNGKEVRTMKVTLTWSCSGSEINWTTLSISITAYKSITPYYENPLVDNVKFVSKSFSDKTGDLSVSLDLVEEIKPYASQLEDGKEIYFTIKIVVKASAEDIYGIKRETEPFTRKATALLEWDEPDLTLEASTDPGYEILSITQEDGTKTKKTVSPLTVLLIFVVLGGAYWILSRKEH